MPTDFGTKHRFSMPDHRNQEVMDSDKLQNALIRLTLFEMKSKGAVYLHCCAGIHRSPLLAIGWLCLIEKLCIVDAMKEVRRCHKQALPILEHLTILDETLDRMTNSVDCPLQN